MNRVLLNNIDHHDLTVAVRTGAAFGDCVDRMAVFPSEFTELQRDVPIVFQRTAEGIEAVALLGVQAGENLFLDDNGWTTRHVPAMQRRGPFSIALSRNERDGDSADLMIEVDLDDPRVGAVDGAPVFREQGGNAPYLDHVTAALRTIFDGWRSAHAIHAELDASGLLRPVAITITADDGSAYELADLLVVDGEALAALPGALLERLHRQGVLQAAVMAHASLANIAQLAERKSRRTAGQ